MSISMFMSLPLDLQDTPATQKAKLDTYTKGRLCYRRQTLNLGTLHFIASSKQPLCSGGRHYLTVLLIVNTTLRVAQIECQGLIILSFPARKVRPWKTCRELPFPTFHLLVLPPWLLTNYHMSMTLLHHTDSFKQQRLGPNIFNLCHTAIN